MTVQNTKLSGYNPNRRPSSIPSYLGLPRISSWKKFANLLRLDTPNKLKCDCFCTGRSMVEMLGLLAIVGVLSVGAIAGYSKAMFKYKLNKQAESFNTLLNNAIQLYPDLVKINKNLGYAQGMSWILNIFSKMNLIPDGMSVQNNRIEDIFKNKITFTYFTSGSTKQYLMSVALNRDSSNKLSEYDRQICHNFVNVAKENYKNLAALEMRSGTAGGSYTSSASLYGELFWLSLPTTNLLGDADVKKIDQFCSSCKSEQYCQLFVYIAVKTR